MNGPANINPYEAPKAPTVAEAVGESAMTREELLAFAGRGGESYWWQWERHGQRDRLWLGWNWGGAFFTALWLAYRRMYRECAIVVIASIVWAQVDALVGRALGREALLGFWGNTLLEGLVIGLIGNGLYLRRARAAVSQARALIPEDLGGRQAWLTHQGGTSWWAVLAALGFSVMLGFAVGYLGARTGLFASSGG